MLDSGSVLFPRLSEAPSLINRRSRPAPQSASLFCFWLDLSACSRAPWRRPPFVQVLPARDLCERWPRSHSRQPLLPSESIQRACVWKPKVWASSFYCYKCVKLWTVVANGWPWCVFGYGRRRPVPLWWPFAAHRLLIGWPRKFKLLSFPALPFFTFSHSFSCQSWNLISPCSGFHL